MLKYKSLFPILFLMNVFITFSQDRTIYVNKKNEVLLFFKSPIVQTSSSGHITFTYDADLNSNIGILIGNKKIKKEDANLLVETKDGYYYSLAVSYKKQPSNVRYDVLIQEAVNYGGKKVSNSSQTQHIVTNADQGVVTKNIQVIEKSPTELTQTTNAKKVELDNLKKEIEANKKAEKERLNAEELRKNRVAAQIKLEEERLLEVQNELVRIKKERKSKEDAEKLRIETERLAVIQKEKLLYEKKRKEQEQVEATRLEAERLVIVQNAELQRIKNKRLETERLIAIQKEELAKMESKQKINNKEKKESDLQEKQLEEKQLSIEEKQLEEKQLSIEEKQLEEKQLEEKQLEEKQLSIEEYKLICDKIIKQPTFYARGSSGIKRENYLKHNLGFHLMNTIEQDGKIFFYFELINRDESGKVINDVTFKITKKGDDSNSELLIPRYAYFTPRFIKGGESVYFIAAFDKFTLKKRSDIFKVEIIESDKLGLYVIANKKQINKPNKLD